jgi:two-component system, NtrC family, response regulator AtoC
MAKRILIIDDEEGIRSVLADLFTDLGYEVDQAQDGRAGLKTALAGEYDLVLCDLSLPHMDGLAILRELKEQAPGIAVVMITGYASMQSAIEAMKLGAYDYITKPFDLNEVQMIAERALERERLIDEMKYLKGQLKIHHNFDSVIGSNPQIQQAYILAAQVADSNASVLILGETGTGKEYLARAIHYQSPRVHGPFVKVSCVALPESLLESELFGHEKGAFTNAVARRIGRFESADGGTLFLDEIGDITQATQLKLLRVLQEKQFERVGGSDTITADVRIVAATNKDFKKAIADGEFREDLYYRLNVITINLPPLRERKEDLPELANHFLRKYCKENRKEIESISPEAMTAIQGYSWPGNIRELENCVHRAVVFCNGRRLLPQHILLDEENSPSPAPQTEPTGPKSLAEVERDHIEITLQQCAWNQTRAAQILGIDRKTLRNKIREYQLGTEIAGTDPDDAAKPHQ